MDEFQFDEVMDSPKILGFLGHGYPMQISFQSGICILQMHNQGQFEQIEEFEFDKAMSSPEILGFLGGDCPMQTVLQSGIRSF
jgi:hypothetical protein